MAKKKKREVTKKVAPKEKVEKETKMEEEKVSKKIEKKDSVENTSKKQVREERAKKAKRKSFVSALFTTFLIAVISSVSLYPLFKSTKFGLDLQGGFEILYKVESIDGEKVTSDMIRSEERRVGKECYS